MSKEARSAYAVRTLPPEIITSKVLPIPKKASKRKKTQRKKSLPLKRRKVR